MRIIDRLRYNQQIKNIPTGGTPAPKENPLLKKQLDQVQKDLNLILTKWTFGDTPFTSASEFINKFAPWVNEQLTLKKEVQEFLKSKGVGSLKDIKPESKELEEFLKFHHVKNLTELEKQWENTEADYLKKIEELNKNKGSLSEADKEKLSEYDDLITERDEAIREKKTLEQQNLALNNRLTLKQQEVNNKEKALEKLKKEKGELGKNLNKKITEKNTLITTLQGDLTDYKKQHQELRGELTNSRSNLSKLQEKYSKQGKLLDTEQLECKRLEEANQKLEKDYQEREEAIKEWKETQQEKINNAIRNKKELGAKIKRLEDYNKSLETQNNQLETEIKKEKGTKPGNYGTPFNKPFNK